MVFIGRDPKRDQNVAKISPLFWPGKNVFVLYQRRDIEALWGKALESDAVVVDEYNKDQGRQRQGIQNLIQTQKQAQTKGPVMNDQQNQGQTQSKQKPKPDLDFGQTKFLAVFQNSSTTMISDRFPHMLACTKIARPNHLKKIYNDFEVSLAFWV